ncbi:hypothetical protein UY3_03668 [Chelonia mydas]|uniref:Uncharacterized protein n=1 Tax=Chelonia mydas TaxID=8469 RepID=M7BPB0_CHEMY|nr:hypothetical protein UY3_03668 [Chelonia mydas]
MAHAAPRGLRPQPMVQGHLHRTHHRPPTVPGGVSRCYGVLVQRYVGNKPDRATSPPNQARRLSLRLRRRSGEMGKGHSLLAQLTLELQKQQHLGVLTLRQQQRCAARTPRVTEDRIYVFGGYCDKVPALPWWVLRLLADLLTLELHGSPQLGRSSEPTVQVDSSCV